MTLTTHTFFADNFRTPGFMSVATYGAKGDGVTDDRAAIQAAIDAAVGLGGCTIYFPPGTYQVGRNGANFYCLLLSGNNVRLQGSTVGQSTIQAVTGLPATSISLLFGDRKNNFQCERMAFDGNWGNAVTAIASSSNNQLLPGSGGPATINVLDTTGFPASGTFTVVLPNALGQVITYTGKTGTSFTGCTGGTGTLLTGQTVGYSDSQAGLNQGDQSGDPQNHGLFLRGCQGVLVENCKFTQIYGDSIWVGNSSTDTSVIGGNTQVVGCLFDIVARNGMSISNSTNDFVVTRCRVTNCFQAQFDVEPAGKVTNVVLESSYFGSWFNPSRNSTSQPNVSVNFSGAGITAPIEGIRVFDCTITGAVNLGFTQDVVIHKNRIIQDWFGGGFAGITVGPSGDSISIDDNYIYSRIAFRDLSHVFNISAIVVTSLVQTATQQFTETNVSVTNNRIKVRNGRYGIALLTVGANTASATGSATAIDSTHLTDALATWTVNQWIGYQVRVGTAIAQVTSNTATTLTLRVLGPYTTSAWGTYLSSPTYTPTAPATYQIYDFNGVCNVDHNTIDCSDDGNGNGGYGIYTSPSVTVPETSNRLTLSRNSIQNATTDGIHIAATSSGYQEVELSDNKIFDTQATPTCTTAIAFETPVNITSLTMRGNKPSTGMAATSGLTTGVWLVSDGPTQQWAGWGSPNGVITAAIGSIFQRLDPGAAAALWVKQSDSTLNTGWVRLTQPTIVGWTVDPGSGIGVPANATEWAAVIAAASLTGIVSVPDALWLCQELAGNLADTIGIFTMTASGAGLTYNQTVSPWQRKGVGLPVNVFQGWSNADASLPDLSVANATLCCYATITNPLNQSSLLSMGTGAGTDTYLGCNTAGDLRTVSGGNAAAFGTLPLTNVVHPYALQSNRTGVQSFGLTDHDKTQPTFDAAVTGKQIQFGNPTSTGTNKTSKSNIIYAWGWLTTTPTPAQIKLIWQVLGWVVDWS